MKHKHVKHHDATDCAAACLAMICLYYKKETTITRLRDMIGTDLKGTNLIGRSKCAEKSILGTLILFTPPIWRIIRMKKGILYWISWAAGMFLIGSSIKISEELFSTKTGSAETLQSIVTLSIIFLGLAIIMSMHLFDKNNIDEKSKQVKHEDEKYKEIDKLNIGLIIGSVAAGVIIAVVFLVQRS